MKGPRDLLIILLILLDCQGFSQAVAQPGLHRVLDRVDMPSELKLLLSPGCVMEFQEEWILNPATFSISKKVNEFVLSCDDSPDLMFPADGALRIKNISYEFSFLDLQEEASPVLQEDAARKLQADFIELITSRFPIHELYNPQEQMLSIYFHEDWILDSEEQKITKQVNEITPVIWQQRQTAEGEALPDPETGYPVFYKLNLERIKLRHP